jgi:hypothetical protein
MRCVLLSVTMVAVLATTLAASDVQRHYAVSVGQTDMSVTTVSGQTAIALLCKANCPEFLTITLGEWPYQAFSVVLKTNQLLKWQWSVRTGQMVRVWAELGYLPENGGKAIVEYAVDKKGRAIKSAPTLIDAFADLPPDTAAFQPLEMAARQQASLKQQAAAANRQR